MEGTVSLAGATSTRISGKGRISADLIELLWLWVQDWPDIRALARAGLWCWVSSQVRVSLRILHVQWPKATIKLAGDECPASNSIKPRTSFGCYSCGSCIYLPLLPVGLSSGMQSASCHHVEIITSGLCCVYITKLHVKTWPNVI